MSFTVLPPDVLRYIAESLPDEDLSAFSNLTKSTYHIDYYRLLKRRLERIPFKVFNMLAQKDCKYRWPFIRRDFLMKLSLDQLSVHSSRIVKLSREEIIKSVRICDRPESCTFSESMFSYIFSRELEMACREYCVNVSHGLTNALRTNPPHMHPKIMSIVVDDDLLHRKAWLIHAIKNDEYEVTHTLLKDPSLKEFALIIYRRRLQNLHDAPMDWMRLNLEEILNDQIQAIETHGNIPRSRRDWWLPPILN